VDQPIILQLRGIRAQVARGHEAEPHHQLPHRQLLWVRQGTAFWLLSLLVLAFGLGWQTRSWGSHKTPAERAKRAWIAGNCARAVAQGRVSSPNCSETIELQNRYWCVVRCSNCHTPRVFTSSSAFFRATGPIEGSSTICHAFPSRAEARIYLEAAGSDGGGERAHYDGVRAFARIQSSSFGDASWRFPRRWCGQIAVNAEHVSDTLASYGRALFYAGKPYGRYSETINAVVGRRPHLRRSPISAWDVAFSWVTDEPHVHHPAMPLSVVLAFGGLALLWGWPVEASIFLMTWCGVLRIGEVLQALRADLVLPCDAAPGFPGAILQIRQPKTRGSAARHQAARIDPEDIVALLTAVFRRKPRQERLWVLSPSTLRKRFATLQNALGMPVKSLGKQVPYTTLLAFEQAEPHSSCRGLKTLNWYVAGDGGSVHESAKFTSRKRV